MGLKNNKSLCQAVKKEREQKSLHTKEKKELEQIDTRKSKHPLTFSFIVKRKKINQTKKVH
ncbi:MAG: hypothetical protein ACJA2M_001247 [Polaribacter sp.]